MALGVAAVFAGIGLFVVGAVKTRVTHKNPWWSGVENLAIGIAGGAVAYSVGLLFDSNATA